MGFPNCHDSVDHHDFNNGDVYFDREGTFRRGVRPSGLTDRNAMLDDERGRNDEDKTCNDDGGLPCHIETFHLLSVVGPERTHAPFLSFPDLQGNSSSSGKSTVTGLSHLAQYRL